VQIVTARVIAVGATAKPELAAAPVAARSVPLETRALRKRRDVWNADADGFTPTPIYARDRLVAGDAFAGPAVIEQYDATTYVAPGWHVHVDVFGDLVIEAANRPAADNTVADKTVARHPLSDDAEADYAALEDEEAVA
jgi:N-methylhydantoinase A